MLPTSIHYDKMLEVKSELAKQVSTREIDADELRMRHEKRRTTSHFSQKSTTPEAETSPKNAIPRLTPSGVSANNKNIYVNNNVNKSSETAYCEKGPLKKERELRYIENKGSSSNGMTTDLLPTAPGSKASRFPY